MENINVDQDDEGWERDAKRHCTQIAGPTSAAGEGVNHELQSSCRTTYESISASGEATLVVGDNYGTLVTHHHHHPSIGEAPFAVLHHSLAFDRIHARLQNVLDALPNTCQWLLHHRHFITWKANGSFLWVKGKPGSGKSTIMREMYSWANKTWPTHCVLSYFFNARSSNMIEKSPLGLYRSILHQLLSMSSLGHDLFYSSFKYKVRTHRNQDTTLEHRVTGEWTEVELQNFLTEYLRIEKLPAIWIIIDALDEGREDDIRLMIGFFERLSSSAGRAGVQVRICLSSRHYPNITVRTNLSIIVEDEHGQTEDIEKYISSELLTDVTDNQAKSLRNEVLERSNGIFLWVVLVIPMLRKLHDQGKEIQAMRQRLSHIPNNLHNLFAEILSRDVEDTNDCIRLFRWVLFSMRPMFYDELYCIVRQLHYRKAHLPRDSTISKYMLNCSRGLTEWTKSYHPVVQFIHETVRDFLLDSSGYLSAPIQSERMNNHVTEALKPSISHMMLAEDCLEHFLGTPSTVDTHGRQYSLRGESLTQWLYPEVCNSFSQSLDFEYTAKFWWLHFSKSGAVESSKLTRLGLLLFRSPRIFRCWMQVNLNNKDMFGKEDSSTLYTPLHCAAALGLSACVSELLASAEDVNAVWGHRGTALLVAAENGREAVVRTLLRAGADVHRKAGPLGRTPLEGAVSSGHEKIAKMLLDSMGGDDPQAKYGHALIEASSLGHAGMVRLLLKDGADPNGMNYGRTALRIASRNNFPDVVQILLDNGACPDVQGSFQLPLPTALRK